MKYFIPVSSLNLENILQAEAILPAPSYAGKLTGYRTFVRVPGLEKCDATALFDHPVAFEINDNERYNFPMLVEFDDDAQTSDLEALGNGTFLCRKPLRLTPSNCAIYFFSEKSHAIAMVTARENMSIKQFRQFRIFPSADFPDITPMPELGHHPLEADSAAENAADKLKGAVVGWLLGCRLSVTPALASRMRISRDLSGLLFAIISSKATQSPHLKREAALLLEQYRDASPEFLESDRELDERLSRVCEEYLPGQSKGLKDLLDALGCREVVRRHLAAKLGLPQLPDIEQCRTTDDFTALRETILKDTGKAIREHMSAQPPLDTTGLAIEDRRLAIADMPLISAVIGSIISSEVTSEKLSSNRKDIYLSAMEGVVDILKDRVGEKEWEGAPERLFINNLFRQLEDIDSRLEFLCPTCGELSAIAAALLFGESYNVLRDALRQNEWTDYRGPLAIWGAICGYMEMSSKIFSGNFMSEIGDKVNRLVFGLEPSQMQATGALMKSTAGNSEIADFIYIIRKSGARKIFADTLAAELKRRHTPGTDLEKTLYAMQTDNPKQFTAMQRKLIGNSLELFKVRTDGEQLRKALAHSAIVSPKAASAIARHFATLGL